MASGDPVGDAKSRYFAKKSVAALAKDARESKLKKTLTGTDLMFLGVGAIIGAGIFTLPGIAAARAGPGVSVSFVISGITCALVALCYAEIATMVPTSGSAYTYIYASMGELLGWLVGWALIFEYAIGNVAVANAWSGYFQSILGAFGIILPPAFAAAPPVGVFNIPAFVITLLVTVVLVIGIQESARTTTALVILKVAVVIFFILAGFSFINPVNFQNFMPFGWGGPGQEQGVFAGAAIVFFAYIGFDAVSTAAEETKNPGKDLPKGIIGSLAICTVLYILVAIVLTGIVPYQEFVGVNDPLATALGRMVTPDGTIFTLGPLVLTPSNAAFVVSLGAIIGLTSVLLVFQLGLPRIFFSMARDGLMPQTFTRIHSKFKTPYVITIISGIIIASASALTPLAAAAELANMGTLFAFALVCVALVVLRKSSPDTVRTFKVPWVPWVPVAGVILCIVLIASLSPITIIRFVAWLGLGLALYGFYGASHSKIRDEPAIVPDASMGPAASGK